MIDWIKHLWKPEHHTPPELEKAMQERDDALATAGEAHTAAVESVKEVDRVNALWNEYEKAGRQQAARKQRAAKKQKAAK